MENEVEQHADEETNRKTISIRLSRTFLPVRAGEEKEEKSAEERERVSRNEG